jgi:hypothetical protein
MTDKPTDEELDAAALELRATLERIIRPQNHHALSERIKREMRRAGR